MRVDPNAGPIAKHLHRWSRRLREYRESRGLTQSDVAEQIGVTEAAVCRYENETLIPGDERREAVEKWSKGEVRADLIPSKADRKRIAAKKGAN